ncbi:hypothetical protein BABINDRAFT_16093, partial [Babjeviella inositovora NRRL Y-12698]
VIFDMLEVITGLRIHNLDEDEEEITFDCSQIANDGAASPESFNWDYKLIVSKLGTSAANDILYIPDTNKEQLANLLRVKGLGEGDRRRVERLQASLPSYFLDTLTFPYDTLPQFYQNLSKALNKKEKE